MNDQVNKLVKIPPALLEEIQNGNADALSATARTQLAYLMETTLYRATQPDAPAQLVTGTMELLRKIGVPQKSDADSGGPQVVINITRAKQDADHTGLTIEGENYAEEFSKDLLEHK